MENRLNQIFETATKDKKVPAVGAIVLDATGKELYKNAFGSTDISSPSAAPFTTTTDLIFWSCTKLITCVAALQLLEQGKIGLDDPVEKFLPEFKSIQVLDGFEEDGTPKLRAPKTQCTILHLMTHTSGFTYDFLDGPTLKWRLATGGPPAAYTQGNKSLYMTPLGADPGTRYSYGVSIDWLGFVVEAVSGQTLEEYFKQNIFSPLGIKQSKLGVEEGKPRLLVHIRNEDGSLTANPELSMPANAEVHGGGASLVSTIEDYGTFLLTILAGGTNPISKAKILSEETVREYIFKDQIHKVCSADGIGDVDRCIPQMSNKGTVLPGVKKGWSCGCLLNLDSSQRGRGQASAAWAGLANLYYWIDPAAGKLGLLVSQVLPYFDEEVLHLFDELERAVYGHDAAAIMGEEGSNFHMVEGIGMGSSAK